MKFEWKTLSAIASIVGVLLTIYTLHRSGIERLTKVETDMDWVKQALRDNGVRPNWEHKTEEPRTARKGVYESPALGNN